MLSRLISSLVLVACGPERAEPPPARLAIEVRDNSGVVSARVVPGHPCRATVDGVELLIGGRPLVAQHGAAKWTGEDAENGTTLKKNDVAIARIHAKQLFDGEGLPLLRVLPDGGITDSASAIVRKAVATADGVTITGAGGELTVTNTNDVVLAAMLTSRETSPEVRALAACHFLLPYADQVKKAL